MGALLLILASLASPLGHDRLQEPLTVVERFAIEPEKYQSEAINWADPNIHRKFWIIPLHYSILQEDPDRIRKIKSMLETGSGRKVIFHIPLPAWHPG